MATTLTPAGIEFKYKLSVSWRYANVDFLGLPSFQDGSLLELKSIYVPTRLLLEPEGRDRHFLTGLLNRHKQIVVLGDPGSGKSVLIQLIAYSLGSAAETPLEQQIGKFIPIPILLRDYNSRQWQNPTQMLRDYIATLADDVRPYIEAEWLLDAMRSGRGALLIDGLDEVGSADDRRRLRDQVLLPLLAESKNSIAVITSRIAGYDEAPFEPVTRCYLAPFGQDEINDYVLRWYTIREPDPNRRQHLIGSLHAAIQRNPQTAELATRPGMLALMALIHRATGKLPSDHLRLYDQIVTAYLETIQSYRKLPPFEASLEQMKRWLAAVGWEMQLLRAAESSRLHASREEITGWLRASIGRETVDPEKFLDYLLRRSGLLVARSPEQIAFTHLSFQEYFAAWRLRGDVRRFDDLCRRCVGLAQNEIWHESLVFLFEMLVEFPGAGDDLLRKLIEGDPANRSTVSQLIMRVLALPTTGVESSQELGAKFIFTTWLENGFQNAKGLAEFAEHFAERFDGWSREWLDHNSQRKYAPIQVVSALVSLGKALISLGNSGRAARLYDQALNCAESALAGSKDDPRLLNKLGFVLDHAGNLMRSIGKAEQARHHFQRSLEIFERLVGQFPDDVDHRRDLSISYLKLGDISQDAGDNGQARDYFEKAFEISRQLADREPHNTEYARDLALLYNRLGHVARDVGDAERARQNYQRGFEIYQRNVNQEPNNTDYLRDLSVSYANLGDVVLDAGQFDQAREYHQQSLEIRQRLASQEPDRVDFLRGLAVSLNRLGDVADATGRHEEARRYFEQSLDLDQRLVNQEPNRADYLRDLSVSFDRLGDVARGAGQPDQARQYYQQSLAIRQRLASQEPDLPGLQIGLAISLRNVGGKENLERARTILTALRDTNQLPQNRQALLTSIEKSLAELSSSNTPVTT